MLYIAATIWIETFILSVWGIKGQSSGNYSGKVRRDITEEGHRTVAQILDINSAQISLNDVYRRQVLSGPTKDNRTEEKFQLLPTQEKLSLQFEFGQVNCLKKNHYYFEECKRIGSHSQCSRCNTKLLEKKFKTNRKIWLKLKRKDN